MLQSVGRSMKNLPEVWSQHEFSLARSNPEELMSSGRFRIHSQAARSGHGRSYGKADVVDVQLISRDTWLSLESHPSIA
jgi:hypothetical protein